MIELIKNDWPWLLISVGIMIICGAIWNWKWVCMPPKGKGLAVFIYYKYGEKGYRILMGIGGAVIIVCGSIPLFLI